MMEQIGGSKKRRRESNCNEDNYTIEQAFAELKKTITRGYSSFEEQQDDIHVLIRKFPKAATHRDKDGCFLLHLTCKHQQSLLVVTQIYDLNRSAIKKKDNKGCNPIHYACKMKQSESVVLKLIGECPQAVKEKDGDGSYPLHYACKHNQSESVVLKLIRIYPEATTVMCKWLGEFRRPNKDKDKSGSYPLHYACRFKQSEKVVLKLINKFPRAIDKMDEFGSYPLHYACQFNKSDTVVLNLIMMFAQAVHKKDKTGNYPLHYACRKKRSEKVILKLLSECPQAARERDACNNFPLLYACRKKKQSDKVLLNLISEYPQAANDINNGYYRYPVYPLYWACQNHVSERVILALINLNFLAVKWYKKILGQNPLWVAKRNCQSATVLQVLEVLTAKSNTDLQNRIDIPKIVTLHGLDNLRRLDTLQWVKENSPILENGQFIQTHYSSRTVNEENDDNYDDDFASLTTEELGDGSVATDEDEGDEDEHYEDEHYEEDEESSHNPYNYDSDRDPYGYNDPGDIPFFHPCF